MKFDTLPLSKIHVPDDRSRVVDEDYALTIQASMLEHFQFQPVVVRQTPNGARPYTLVDGAHRYRAIELLDDDGETINVLVVKADSAEAAMIEVAANIYRNELSVLDRAVAVQMYRAAWEEKHGEIRPGNKGLPIRDNLSLMGSKGDDKQRGNLTLCSMDLVSEEAKKGFGTACAERLGLSEKAVQRANRIVQNLPPALLARLRNTAAADNQSQLLAFAKMPPDKREKAVHALELAQGDVKKALKALSDKKPDTRNAQQKLRDTVLTAYARMTPQMQDETLKEMIRRQKPIKAKPADQQKGSA